MNERATLRLSKKNDNTYKIESWCLERVGDPHFKPTIMKWPGEVGTGECCFGPEKTVRRIVLAFIRVALWRCVSRSSAMGSSLPIFRESQHSQIFNECAVTIESATTDGMHPSKWLREMCSIKEMPEDGKSSAPPTGDLLRNWFVISRAKPAGLLSVDSKKLPPDSVVIIVNGEIASENEIQYVESYFSILLQAGMPLHYEARGIKFGGQPPPMRPGWVGQEEEWMQIQRFYCLRNQPIVCAYGETLAGKTVLTRYWLHRILGSHELRHYYVFMFSFQGQDDEKYIPRSSHQFFKELAGLLEISFENASPVSQAQTILQTLVSKPTLFLLDGVEATFIEPQGANSIAVNGEWSTGLVHLLKGIAMQKESFVLASSQMDFASYFGIGKQSVGLVHVKPTIIPKENQLLGEYQDDPSTEESDVTNGGVSVLGLEKNAESLAPNQPDKKLQQFVREMQPRASTYAGFLGRKKRVALNARQKKALNLILEHQPNAATRILLYIICASNGSISESDLLDVSSQLPLIELGIYESLPSSEEWEGALESLVADQLILQQATRGPEYSVHGTYRNEINHRVKTYAHALWIAINRKLGELILNRAVLRPESIEDLQPLAEAAFHFCESGDRKTVYDEIGYERMSRRLKAYAIFQLGDYETPKAINAALLDADVTKISPLPRHVEAFCVHVYALCSRYLDQLENALEQERDAYRRAKLTKKSIVILPIGFNLLRLFHIFGKLKEARQIEYAIILRLVVDELNFFRDREKAGEEEIIDGASALSSIYALSLAYRGKSLAWRISPSLGTGIKKCRNAGAKFDFLMPSHGRLWHALVLLETGQWEVCEKAINANEWHSSSERYKQTGCFELLAAKTYLAKATALDGRQRSDALAKANVQFAKALPKASNYRWWRIMAQLTQAQMLLLDHQLRESSAIIESAYSESIGNKFPLLQVDALVVKARIEFAAGRFQECWKLAKSAQTFSMELGYGLRKLEIEKLLNARK